MPVPVFLALLLIGLFFTRGGRACRLGRFCLIVGTLVPLVASNEWVSRQLSGPLESAYPAIPEIAPGSPVPPALAACRWVVVLGSGHADIPSLAALDKLSTAGLARIAEGVRIARILPSARLLVSGPAEGGRPSHASVLAAAAVSLGIAPDRIRQIDTAHDTEQESHAVRAIVGTDPVALVTSAIHMPRAAALFRAAGVSFVPCPTDYTGRAGAEATPRAFLLDAESLDRTTWAVRERLGYAWLALRGRIRQ